jgi:hypothetical protein
MLRRRTRAALHHAAWSCIYSPPAGIGLMSEAEPSIGRNRQEHLGVLEPLRITSSTEQMHASAPASCKAAISTMPLPGWWQENRRVRHERLSPVVTAFAFVDENLYATSAVFVDFAPIDLISSAL